ncbi:MAG: VOC family protein [Nanoarchaeota archaeon]|nr:VOC family protein [Nanoarchaeota archaeon]
MTSKFLHLRLRVKDTERSVNFYKENFGCEVVNRKTSPRGNKLTFLSLPGDNAVLELCEFPKDINTDFKLEEDIFHLAFSVDSMKEAYEQMISRGVKFTEGGPEDSMTFIEDPDGYEIELLERS